MKRLYQVKITFPVGQTETMTLEGEERASAPNVAIYRAVKHAMRSIRKYGWRDQVNQNLTVKLTRII